MNRRGSAAPVVIMVLVLLAVILVPLACNNARARSWGGTMKVDIPAGQKLVNATWKEDNFWYLTRPMAPGEKPENYVFQEKSLAGMFEGKVELYEHAAPAR